MATVESARRPGALFPFLLSAALAAAVWALSVPLTGKPEPWDAQGPYYPLALALAGAIAGFIRPSHFGAHYAGAIAGQAAYGLVFLPMGALFVLGLVFLAGYSAIFVATALIVASFRRKLAAARQR